MLLNSHTLLCNGAGSAAAKRAAKSNPKIRPLWTFGPNKVVRLRLHEMNNALIENPPEVVTDLLELAALVFGADQWCARTPGNVVDYGDKWLRSFNFQIAVRRPEFWNKPAVKSVLTETLSFLSGDEYEFSFTPIQSPPMVQEYFEYQRSPSPKLEPVQEVMLMSGGLDSLAGAAEQLIKNQRPIALVSHKPVDYVAVRQQALIDQIVARSDGRRLKPLRVPVTANMIGASEPEPTQRSRSFLYAALGAAVANSMGLDEVVFYENGIVSVNLPLCGQEICGRATRTTHPQSLHGFSKLFSLVFGRPFKVSNAYLWHTKQDVLDVLTELGHPDLARESVSCIHTRFASGPQPHCGLCSQCLSRRIAALGADYNENDRADGYRQDVLMAPRTAVDSRILAERFVGQAMAVARMTTPHEFNLAYAGELARVYPYVEHPPQVAADKLFELHRRHAKQVGNAIVKQIRARADDFWNGSVPSDSAMSYAFGGGHQAERSARETATAERADGFYAPRTLVYQGVSHEIALNAKEAAFMHLAMGEAELSVYTLMHPAHGVLFKRRYQTDRPSRQKISLFLSRLSKHLLKAKPALRVRFSLPREGDHVLRDDPDTSTAADNQLAHASPPSTGP